MTTEIKENTQEKALAPFERIRDVLAAYPSSRFHLLTPTTLMASSPLFVPTPTAVVVNPNDDRQVYKTPGARSDEEVSFHATTLQRIANAGGLDFDTALDRHEHDLARDPLVCRYSVAAWYLDSLGQRRLLGDGVTHDLRDGSPRAKFAASPKQLEVSRQFICEQARTRAMSRVIRKVMNLALTYRKSELVFTETIDGKQVTRPKPFVTIRFRLDESDPDVKKALIERGVGAAHEVFGTRPLEIAPPPAIDELDDVIEGEGREAKAPAHEPEPVEEEAPAAAASAVAPQRAREICAHVEQMRSGLRWSPAARKERPNERQVGLVATTIAKAVAGDAKRLGAEQQKALRRVVLEALFGPFGSYDELSSDRVSAAIDWSKAFPDEVRDLVESIGQTDTAIATFLFGLRGQQELLGGER